MAKLVMIANQKGGVGKSTTTMLAATALSQPPFSYRVVVVDIDPQASIAARRTYDLDGQPDHTAPYPVLTMTWQDFTARVEGMDLRYQLIFLDVPGKLDADRGGDSEAVQALQYVDTALVPVTPGNFSLEATLAYLKIALAVRDNSRPALQLVAFRNMHRERSRHASQLAAELDDLASITDVRLMTAPLKRYSDYEDADTLTSLYSTTSTAPARAGFTSWLDELHTILIKTE